MSITTEIPSWIWPLIVFTWILKNNVVIAALTIGILNWISYWLDKESSTWYYKPLNSSEKAYHRPKSLLDIVSIRLSSKLDGDNKK